MSVRFLITWSFVSRPLKRDHYLERGVLRGKEPVSYVFLSSGLLGPGVTNPNPYLEGLLPPIRFARQGSEKEVRGEQYVPRTQREGNQVIK